MGTIRKLPRREYVEIEEVQGYEPPAPGEAPYRNLFPMIITFFVLSLIITFWGLHMREQYRLRESAQTGRATVAEMLRQSEGATPAGIESLVDRFDEHLKWMREADLKANDRAAIASSTQEVGASLARRLSEHLTFPEYLQPEEHVSLALSLQKLYETPGLDLGGVRLAAPLDELIAGAATRGTERVLELGRADAGMSDLLRARQLVNRIVPLVSPAEQVEYRRASQDLLARIERMEAEVRAMYEGDAPEADAAGLSRRQLYAERTFAALQRAGVSVSQVESRGEGGRNLYVSSELPSGEVADLFAGSSDLKEQLISLGFESVTASGEGGQVEVDLLQGRSAPSVVVDTAAEGAEENEVPVRRFEGLGF